MVALRKANKVGRSVNSGAKSNTANYNVIKSLISGDTPPAYVIAFVSAPLSGKDVAKRDVLEMGGKKEGDRLVRRWDGLEWSVGPFPE